MLTDVKTPCSLKLETSGEERNDTDVLQQWDNNAVFS